MLNNVKLAPKLIGGFALVAAIAALIGVVGISKIGTIADADTMLYEKMLVPVGQLGDISVAFQRVRVNLRDVILADDPAKIAEKTSALENLSREMDRIGAEYERLIVSDQMRRAFEEFKATEKRYNEALPEILALAQANKDEEATKVLLYGTIFAAAQAEQAALDKMQEMKVAQAKETAVGNTETATGASTLMIAVIAIGSLLAVAIGWLLARSIAQPMAQGVNMM
ncbi:MAG: MCP four helix bundle domain-containing protein, partial [Candidatus Latescibacteria bacterium]|nr:MCP four helix bundle domain-containing protein [Candidatus Latescibacterota bacterium]